MKQSKSKQQLSEHFTLEEFVHSDTALFFRIDNTPSAAAVNNMRKLCINILEPARMALGQPIQITSGYRSPALNRHVGGVSNSAHLYGRAADIYLPSMTYYKALWACLLERNFDQLILEHNNRNNVWIHVSFANKPRKQIFTIGD